MDEMTIKSSFIKNIISKIIVKAINKKFGTNIALIFRSPIVAKIDDENANFEMDMIIAMKRDDISKLTEKLM